MRKSLSGIIATMHLPLAAGRGFLIVQRESVDGKTVGSPGWSEKD
jgi:hypothetical protein